MKKLLTAIALVLALTGCATDSKEDETPKGPTAIQTLDVETYSTELEKTEFASVKVKYATGDATIGDIEEYLTEEDVEFRTNLLTTLKTLNLTKAENQDKIYATPVLYIDLYNAAATNYARFSVYETEETTVVILTNEGFVNYTVNDVTGVDTLKTTIFDYYTAE